MSDCIQAKLSKTRRFKAIFKFLISLDFESETIRPLI